MLELVKKATLHFDTEKFLWNSGLLTVILQLVFKADDLSPKVQVIKFLIENDFIIPYTKILFDAYLPLDFYEAMYFLSVDETETKGDRRIEQQLKRLEVEEVTESPFVIWSGTNTKVVKAKLDDVVSTITEKYNSNSSMEDDNSDEEEQVDSSEYINLTQHITHTPFKNPLNQLSVNSIQIRVFNNSPTLFLSQNLQ